MPRPSTSSNPSPPARPQLRVRLVLLVMVLAVSAGLVVADPPRALLTRAFFNHLPPFWAAPAFVAVFALGTLVFLPKPLLNAAAGALFGLPEGLALAMLGGTLGAALAFALGRSLGRDAVRPWLRFKAWDALDRRLSGGRGFRTVLMLRLIPAVPAPAVNYGAAFSGLPLRSFVAATALGIVPGALPYVAAGAAATAPSAPALWGAAAALLLGACWGGAALLRARRTTAARSGAAASG